MSAEVGAGAGGDCPEGGDCEGCCGGEVEAVFGVLVEAFGGNDRVCLAAAVTAERDLVGAGVVEALVRF